MLDTSGLMMMLYALLIVFLLAIIATMVSLRCRDKRLFQREKMALVEMVEKNKADSAVETVLTVRKIPLASKVPQAPSNQTPSLRVINLKAPINRPYLGYELLQTLLTANLKHGDMNIFHYHQFPNGKGPILFSLASANEPGAFDIQKIGELICSGLCLFMHETQKALDEERYALMLKTAEQLQTELGGELCDHHWQPLPQTLINH